jgi:hypothetical protein
VWTASAAAGRELRIRRLRRGLATVVLAGGAGLSLVSAAPVQAASVGDAAQFLGLINGLRAGHGAAPLAWNGQLAAIAQAWSGHQAAAGTLAHNPSLGSEAPAGWTSLGENVGEGGSVAILEAAFVASPPHEANMANPRFGAVGIGVVQAGSTLWVTEDFLGGATTASPPPPPPAVRPAPTPASRPHSPSPPPPATRPPTVNTLSPAPASPGPGGAPPVDPSITLVLQRLQGLDQGISREPDSPVR